MKSAKAILLQVVQKIKQDQLKKGENLSAKAILLQMIRKIREKPAAKAAFLKVIRKIKQEKLKKESAKMDQEDLSLFQMSGNKKGQKLRKAAKMDREDMSQDLKQEKMMKKEKLMKSAKAILLQVVQKIKKE